MSEPDILNRLRDVTDKAEGTDGMRAAVPFLRMAIDEIVRLRRRQIPKGLAVEYDDDSHVYEIGYWTEGGRMFDPIATIPAGR